MPAEGLRYYELRESFWPTGLHMRKSQGFLRVESLTLNLDTITGT
jgi:hypothetical protein